MMIHSYLKFKFIAPAIVSAGVVCISSCNIINPAEPIPAYVHINSIPLSTDILTEGSNTSNIVDAWVYVDGTIVGTYELPVTMPVLSAGSHKLTVRPGILIDGIASTRTNYPFYAGYDTILNFESEKTFTVSPRTAYVSSVQFSQLEDFDQTGITLVKIPGSDTTIYKVLDQYSLEGQSGKVTLDGSHSFFACASKDSFPLSSAAPAYIELDFRSENEFTVGLITYTSSSVYSTNIVTFKTSDSWKKEYINLTPIVSTTSNALGYKLFIKATKSSSLTTASIYFDNIKVVH